MPEGNPALQRSAPTEVRHCKKPRPPSRPTQIALHTSATETTARGFEPLRAEPNGFLVHHLNHSVTLSCERSHTAGRLTARATFRNFATRCNRAAKWRERHQRRNARAVDGLHRNDPQRNASASKMFSNCLPTQRVQQTGQAAAISTAEWCQWFACWGHNPKVRGSKPSTATFLRVGPLQERHLWDSNPRGETPSA